MYDRNLDIFTYEFEELNICRWMDWMDENLLNAYNQKTLYTFF